MSQGIYSLLLQECLVDAVDAMAEEKQMSRSQVINEILSERFEMFTPEYRSNHIMDVVRERLSGNDKFHLISFSKGSSIQYKMIVPYKYNPKIKMMLIMNSKDPLSVATLKVSSRTTNVSFSDDLWGFFESLNHVTENHGRMEKYPMLVGAYDKSDAIYKKFPIEWTKETLSFEEIAREITNYMYMLSESLIGYFESLEDPVFGKEEMERIIHKYF